MCGNSEREKLHFDTRQFNHILYEDHDSARKALTDRIVAHEGLGAYVPKT